MAIAINGNGTVTGLTALPDSAMSSGSVVQVVQTVISDVKSYTPSGANTYTDMPGFTGTITPSSSSNKILITVGIGGIHQDYGTIAGKIQRGTTDIGVGDANGSRPRSGFRMYGASIYNTNHCGSYHYTFLDSPATTNATTYKLVTMGEGGSGQPVYLNRSVQDSNNAYSYRSTTISTMTLMEIVA
tara:strand:- start:74 stop:631 length:558 start_codon:yes stop_codon:yes gene_type:complete